MKTSSKFGYVPNYTPNIITHFNGVEHFASVLRQRALFSATNPPRGNSPIDSRVSVPDSDVLSILPNSVRSSSSQRDRDRRPHGRKNSSPSRSKSRSRSRSRSYTPEFRLAAVHLTLLHPLTSSTSPALNPAKFGLRNSEAKELRLKFKSVFEGSFDLFYPKLDESMERDYVEVNSISDDGLNATNAACLEPDESGRSIIEQYRILSPFNRLCLRKRFQIAA
uniref:Uncharacterized protein n=1 Tax=Daphnia galeata TaxID=27404 RepID=A0A8J2S640_9CRUS|nr:unnamed protein product [Daphnia galeata]